MPEVAELATFTPEQINFLKRICEYDVRPKKGEDRDSIYWRVSRQELIDELIEIQKNGSTDLNTEVALKVKYNL